MQNYPHPVSVIDLSFFRWADAASPDRAVLGPAACLPTV